MALEMGMKVERLKDELELEEKKYPRGSFIVYENSAKKDDWSKLYESLPFAPGMISDKRALHGDPLLMPRTALVETYFHDMDAGWTRFLFDTYHIPYTVLHPGDLASADLVGEYDVVIFPDNDKSILMTGKQKSGDSYYMGSYPPEYVKGMEKEGMENLMTFSDQGGIIIAWGRSSGLFEGLMKIKGKETEEEFQLPFSDLSPALVKAGLYVPGSLVKLDLIKDHPLTAGMPGQIGVFSRGRPVFQTSVPMFDSDRRVIGTYPEKDVVMSGYGANAEKMGNKAAMIWLKKGKGQFVFYGFGPQFRVSTQGSFKLLFNAMLLERDEG